MDLRELIEYENENTNLDFKKIPYRKEMFGELLKDIVAMANADTRDDRFIIIGVKHYPDGRRDVLGIDDFVDDAIYQKLVNDNIEPDVYFEYSTIDFDDKKLAYFRIYNCIDQPYMFKKDYNIKDSGTIQRGESFVRKGSFTTRLVRRDIDRIFKSKLNNYNFEELIEVTPQCNESKDYFSYASSEFVFPSDEAKLEIEEAIIYRERVEREKRESKIDESIRPELKSIFNVPLLDTYYNPYGPYEQRNIHTLKKNLEDVRKDYSNDDAHACFEENGNKLNILLYNRGDRYIDDASVEVTLERNFLFFIADKIYKKPSSYPIIDTPNWDSINYPLIQETDDEYVIHSEIGRLRHGLTSTAFKVPIRIFFPHESINNQLVIKVKIFGENIAVPVTKTIKINVIGNNE